MTRIALRRKSLELPRGCTFMARIAVYRRVRTVQREAILVVSNRLHGDHPALHGVTRFAIRAELAVMNVRMTIRAFLSYIRKNEFHVALGALHLFVHATEGISRRIVTEFRDAADGLPTQGCVAVLAGDVDGTVRVARRLLLWPIDALHRDVERQQPQKDLVD